MNEISKKIISIINKGGVVSKTHIARLMHRYSLDARDKAIKKMIKDGLIEYRSPISRKTGVRPTFYNLSTEGIKTYNKLVKDGEIE